MLWLICVVAVIILHIPYLRVAYFWDEAGYYFPAALELAQQGHLIPHTTMSNPHPPMLSLYLAAFYKIFGPAPIVTRIAMCVVAGTALYALLLLATLLVPAGSGLWATGLLVTSPLFFAQSSLAHLDVAATAATLLAIYFFLRGRIAGYLIAATVLCLTRETSAFIVVLLAVLAWRNPPPGATPARRALMLAPLVPLAAWFVYVRVSTGMWLGNADFATYNLRDALNPLRFIATLLRRLFFLLVTDFRWVLAFPALHALWESRKKQSDLRPARPGNQLLWLVVALQIVVMSLLGGAILERYILPALALFYLLAVEALDRFGAANRKWSLLALTLAQIACLFWNPPYPFPYEENLAYADFVNLHETAGDQAARFSGKRILTTWPATDEFIRPELGYVSQPVRVVPIPDFSETSFDKLHAEDFDVVFMFSNEWQPQYNLLNVFPWLDSVRRGLYHGRPQMPSMWVRRKFNLVSLGAIHLRGQWVEWMERVDELRPPHHDERKVYRNTEGNLERNGGTGRKATFRSIDSFGNTEKHGTARNEPEHSDASRMTR